MLHGKQILILDNDESARGEVQGVLNVSFRQAPVT